MDTNARIGREARRDRRVRRCQLLEAAEMRIAMREQRQRAEIVRGVPLGRVGTPLDVARACLFFACELSDFITGEVMDVNGGLHID